MMTDHELTDMVLAAMRQRLEEKDWPGASGFRDMANPAEHPAARGTAEGEVTSPVKTAPSRD